MQLHPPDELQNELALQRPSETPTRSPSNPAIPSSKTRNSESAKINIFFPFPTSRESEREHLGAPPTAAPHNPARRAHGRSAEPCAGTTVERRQDRGPRRRAPERAQPARRRWPRSLPPGRRRRPPASVGRLPAAGEAVSRRGRAPRGLGATGPGARSPRRADPPAPAKPPAPARPPRAAAALALPGPRRRAGRGREPRRRRRQRLGGREGGARGGGARASGLAGGFVSTAPSRSPCVTMATARGPGPRGHPWTPGVRNPPGPPPPGPPPFS